MKFPVLWSGLVSRVGASHRVNLMHLSPLDRNAQENYYDYEQLHRMIYFVVTCINNITEHPEAFAQFACVTYYFED